MGGIPPPLALWAMCITSRLMELQTVLSIAEWGVMHISIMLFLLLKLFLAGNHREGLLLRSGCSCVFLGGSVRPKYWFRLSSFRFSDFTSFSLLL